MVCCVHCKQVMLEKVKVNVCVRYPPSTHHCLVWLDVFDVTIEEVHRQGPPVRTHHLPCAIAELDDL